MERLLYIIFICHYILYRRLLNILSQFLFIALSGRKLFQKIYQEKASQH